MRSDWKYLMDILQEIQTIQDNIGRFTYSTFLEDTLSCNGFIRSLEIIGEAVKHLTPSIREAHPTIPWKKIAGLRDVLIHAYGSVDTELVWGILTKEIAPLQETVLSILEEFDE